MNLIKNLFVLTVIYYALNISYAQIEILNRKNLAQICECDIQGSIIKVSDKKIIE